MAGPAIIDTPDYQRGVVSAQRLLAVVPSTQLIPIGEVTVGIPPNAESLIVVANAGNITVTGVTTGTSYVGSLLRNQFGAQTMTSVFDISAGLDSQAVVSAGPEAPKSPWYVYSDSGVHITADLSAAANLYGVRYATLVPPSNISGDHPPVELQVVSNQYASGATVLPVPLAGTQYRLFSAQAAVSGAGAVWKLQTTPGTTGVLWTVGDGNSHQTFPPSGHAIGGGQGLQAYNWTGGGTYYATVAFTSETI